MLCTLNTNKNVTFSVKKTYFIEEMLKNKHNIIFEQLAPTDITGSVVDVLKKLYSNYTDRIDKLPKHIVNIHNRTYIPNILNYFFFLIYLA